MEDERGTRLLVSIWTLCLLSLILLFLRVYCKLWRGKGLWHDDWCLIAAWVALAISVSLNTYLVSLGFGRHAATISDENLITINKTTIVGAAFGIMATTISKTSFAITLYRIATNAWMKYFLIFIIVTINVSMNLVWIFGFAKCTPLERVWNKKVPGTCWDKSKLLTFQLFAAYYSAILDFVLALLPWVILMRMTMRRRERLGVAVAMSLGAIAGITGIVKAVLVVSMKSEDITYDRVDLTIWTLTEPAASIMAICIPVLRMLYRELKSSSRSYNRNRTNTTPRDVDTRNTAGASNARQSKRYNPNSRYGRNSVVIMSGWQESQEHLQDDSDGSQSQTKMSMSSGGVMKTEEVRVHHERLSTFSDENSIELRGLPPAQGKPGHQNTERAPSF
ncbi:integral membrane protein pth11 [Fusarium circinatum]|uniref:Integral membrane protein pth11 n=2 Tax=Fusarium fujikuroi species complex TaxID=171627 RepID=A0A8H5PGF2_GIBSU|nr:integral membrane protein pth11 [Fusarium subglutinans]KAF5596411.1 integral membrane protein pth11 [Fusarium subglutinans]KAF5655923.1 integral membrane protein pth11 [Fusarium circinatum]